jgi:xanthine dehydrogenase accessory factor
MKLTLLQRALEASRSGQAAALATNLTSGLQSFIADDEVAGTLTLDAAAMDGVRRALADDKSTTLDTPEGAVFVEVFNPRLRCIIVGAVHIAQPLAQIASLAGYLVTVVDPRSAFATDLRFPGVELSTEWPDDAMAALRPNRRTAIVTLTHDPKLDDPALAGALRSDAFYIGALGSRKTHAARCRRLTEEGFTEAELARIHGPVGLNIGAISPAEIAVSIMAQITEVLREDRRKERDPA